MIQNDAVRVNEANFEREPEGMHAGVQIQQLRKVLAFMSLILDKSWNS